ncbi:MAG: hypothetical protein HY744_12080 [Deltaproteobacteria bacterium]|nr:hypothetical protein [Deltaproteobacteria bacterium]
MPKHCLRFLAFVLAALAAACSLELDPRPSPPTIARFDPSAGVIPMPSDVVVDDETGHIGLPIAAGMTPAEQDLRAFLNEGKAWSTAFAASVEFSGPVDRHSVTAQSFQLWDFGAAPAPIEWRWDDDRPAGYEGPIVVIEEGGTTLRVDPPRAGWARGGRYVLFVRGGAGGVRDSAGLPVQCDKIFYFVRLPVPLDRPENQRAFPGATRAERLEVAGRLEKIRRKLDPFFRYFEGAKLPASERIGRDEIVALWSFAVTTETELAMDPASQRMPLPVDLLVDPQTGLVDLPAAPWDSQIEADAKSQLRKLSGFGLSANLLFELTAAVDPATASPQSIQLFRLGDAPAEVPLERIEVMAEEGSAPCQQAPVAEGCKHLVLVVRDEALPLAPAASYALVVRDGLRAADGGPIRPMLIGHLMRAEHPLVVDGVSQLGSVPDDLAGRLELSRARMAGLLGQIGREGIITAWPFTTMDAASRLQDAFGTAERLGTPVDLLDIKWKTLDAFNKDEAFESLFPGVAAQAVREVYALRLAGVARVVEGAIRSPYLLDRTTRRLRADGGYELEDVRFVMTIPESAGVQHPPPVVIFAHAIVTDRRFVLTIAGELAQRGYAAIAIDLPFHGERIACVESSLVAIPNFLSEELKDLLGFHDGLIMLPPCLSGKKASCSPTGECLDANGNPEPFNSFLTLAGKPAVVDLKPASGAAFLDINDIPYINDHFVQALADLGALKRVLRGADWEKATGYPIRTDRFYLAGQSLGAIVGSVVAALDPDTERAVLNVPGADLVDLFMDSTYFRPLFDDFFAREQIAPGSFEQERLLDVARWLIDSVDPQAVAHLYQSNGTPALIQIDSGAPGGDIIIPNRTTRLLQRISGLPMREYDSILHADLVVPGLGDKMLQDMARFLAGEIDQ